MGAIMGAEFEDIDQIQAPAIVVDPTGVAVVAFAFEIQSQYMVFAIRTDATAAFMTDVARIETKDDATDDDPNDDRPGDGAGARRRSGGQRHAHLAQAHGQALRRVGLAASARVRGGLSTATLLETRDIGSVEWPTLAVGSDGTAVAVWDYTVEPDVWAAVFR